VQRQQQPRQAAVVVMLVQAAPVIDLGTRNMQTAPMKPANAQLHTCCHLLDGALAAELRCI
jgi:hypothetical protein